MDNNIQVAEYNIVVGLNISNYPNQSNIYYQSGLNIGEDNPSFIPYHAFGPLHIQALVSADGILFPSLR